MKQIHFRDSKWIYVLLSILIATVFWLYVRRTQDPAQDGVIRNIPVTLIGERVLEGQGLTVKSVSAETVNLKVNAPLSVLNRLKEANMSVSLDVSRLSAVGEYPVGYTINYPNNVNVDEVEVNERIPNEITVTIDKLASETFEIESRLEGSIADGYQAGSWSLSQDTVTISGALEQVNQVAKVEAVLKGENLTERLASDVPLTLLDKDGNILTDLDVNLSIDTVYVTLPIVVVKEVPLTVNFISGGGATQDDVQDTYKIFPDTIIVSGEEEAIADLDEICLGSVDLAKVVGTSNITFPINLDSRLENVSGVTQAVVTVTVDNLTTATFEVSNIELIHVPNGRTAQATTQRCSIVVRGHEEDLALVDASQFRIVADLADITSIGSCTVPVTVYLNASQSVGVIGEYSIVVNIS